MKLKRILLLCITCCCMMPLAAQKEMNSDPMYRWMKLINVGGYLSTGGSKAYIHADWNLHLFLYTTDHLYFASEVDYISKRRDAKLTGWKFTPLNASYVITKDLPSLRAGCSVSYLNNNTYLNNAWMITPHITYDAVLATFKVGYDYDLRNKASQFGITLQVSLSSIPVMFHYIGKGT